MLLALVGVPAAPLAAGADEIRVALLPAVRNVELGGGPLLVRDVSGRTLMPVSTTWLRLGPGRRGGLEIRAGTSRLRAMAAGALRVVSAGGRPVRVNARDYPGAVEIARSGTGLLVINTLPLEDYLPGVVKAEAGEAMPLEMLKAQAVVARTYAAYHRQLNAGKSYHLGASTAHQQYSGAVSAASPARLAVEQTRGQVLFWDGALFPAFYHTDSGGHTEDPRVVYDTHAMPALPPIAMAFASESAHREWTLDLRLADLAARLRRGGIPVGPVLGLEVVERSGTLRVTRIAVRGPRDVIVLRGNEFRRLVGYDVLKSTLFEVSVEGAWARFVGRGYGHGIGMDQARAKTMADLAYRAPDILAYFYPGAVLAALR